MTGACNCSHCPAFRLYCEGCSTPCRYSGCEGRCDGCAVRCGRRQDLEEWLVAIGGLGLDMPLEPQPQFLLTGYLPQVLNGLEISSALQRAGDMAVAIDKLLTSRGRVSRRALPSQFGPYNFRAQWGINTLTRLICVGNCSDGYLERLWAAQARPHGRMDDIWMQIRVLGFDFATSLNFSIYFDQPRMEHLVNIKRTWLTVEQMQQMSTLLPLPHLQWATVLDLQRQLHYVQEQGFHTLTMNLQMVKRQGWDVVAPGFPLIREQAPAIRFLFAGVASLRRMQELAGVFPGAAFTNTTAHYLAHRYVRLQRDGTRLIKEPVDGHPDLILAENVRLFGDLFRDAEPDRKASLSSPQSSPPGSDLAGLLRTHFGYEPQAAHDAAAMLVVDEAILAAFQTWLQSGELDPDFGGSFPSWPCSGCVPHPTLGQLLDEGADPIDAFLHLAHLAHEVDEEIQVLVGQAGL